MTPPRITDPGLAVSLSSSFCGYHAHAGFLNRLDHLGIHPGRIAGASAGALTGGLWAAGVRGEELERLLLSIWFKRAFFDPMAIPRFHLLLTGLGPSGIFSGSRLRRYLKRRIGDPRIEDLKEPVIELAVSNLTRSQGELKKQGSLIDYMIASLAVPVLFTVQKIDGEEFVDGGVVNETPFEHWLDDPEIHTIVVHYIRHKSGSRGLPWWTATGVGAAAHSVASTEFFRRRREMAAASGKRVIFVETLTVHPGVFQGRKARLLMDAGAESAQRVFGDGFPACGDAVAAAASDDA